MRDHDLKKFLKTAQDVLNQDIVDKYSLDDLDKQLDRFILEKQAQKKYFKRFAKDNNPPDELD